MKLSTRSRYGVRLMTALACASKDKPVFLKDIAAAEEISEKYLSLIVIPLRGAGLIKSRRGARGGYSLTKDPHDISLLNIIEALDGKVSLVSCVKHPSECNRALLCPTRDVWSHLGSQISDSFNSILLSQLADARNNKLNNS